MNDTPNTDPNDLVDLSDDGSWWSRNFNLDPWEDPWEWAVDRLQWLGSGGALLEANAEVVVPVVKATGEAALEGAGAVAESTAGRYVLGLAAAAAFVGGLILWRR